MKNGYTRAPKASSVSLPRALANPVAFIADRMKGVNCHQLLPADYQFGWYTCPNNLQQLVTTKTHGVWWRAMFDLVRWALYCRRYGSQYRAQPVRNSPLITVICRTSNESQVIEPIRAFIKILEPKMHAIDSDTGIELTHNENVLRWPIKIANSPAAHMKNLVDEQQRHKVSVCHRRRSGWPMQAFRRWLRTWRYGNAIKPMSLSV